MKGSISIIATGALAICAAFIALCACNEESVKRGPTDVDYGDVAYIDYVDEPLFTFKYLDCFIRSSDEGDAFVGKTSDDNGVLSFDVSALTENREYDAIKAYSDDEAQNMLTIAMGLVGSHGAEREVTSFTFTSTETHILLEMSVTSTYGKSGEIQGDYILKYILSDGTVYTLHAFVPISCTEKYGPPFKDAAYLGE